MTADVDGGLRRVRVGGMKGGIFGEELLVLVKDWFGKGEDCIGNVQIRS